MDESLKPLPGIEVSVDPGKCDACGRCARNCPRGAISIRFEGEDALFERLMARVDGMADIRRKPNV